MSLIISPPSPISQGVARITIAGSALACTFPVKDKAFIRIMKANDLTWTYPRWVRTIGPRAGDVSDRVAELGRALLAANFIVQFPDETTRDRAVSGDFAPEQKRWVMRLISGEHKDWFLVRWERYSDTDWYHQAMRLDGARYEPPFVAVPGEFYADVLDFARVHGFSLSQAARELAVEQEQARAGWLVMEIAAPPVQPPDENETIEIPDELLDEPL